MEETRGDEEGGDGGVEEGRDGGNEEEANKQNDERSLVTKKGLRNFIKETPKYLPQRMCLGGE